MDKTQHIKESEIIGQYSNAENPIVPTERKEKGRHGVARLERYTKICLDELLDQNHPEALREIEQAREATHSDTKVRTMNLNEVRVQAHGVSEYMLDIGKAYDEWFIWMGQREPKSRELIINLTMGYELKDMNTIRSRTGVRNLLRIGLDKWLEIRGKAREKSFHEPTKDKQVLLLHFLYDYTVRNGVAPLVSEMESHCGYTSRSTLLAHLDDFVSRNLIEKVPAKKRGIKVLWRPV